MLRLGSSLPLRLLRDGAPRQITPVTTIASSAIWQRQFSTTEPLEIKKRGALIHFKPRLRKKKRYSDPQQKRLSEARQRKNMARQAVLQEERALALGDPVRGIAEPTPFVKSLDTALDPDTPEGVQPQYLNDYLTPSTLDASLKHSYELLKHPEEKRGGAIDRTKQANIEKLQQAEHKNAQEAINRILAVPVANAKQRKQINIQRCIQEFGRHNTDKLIAAKNPGLAMTEANTDDASAIAEAEANSRAAIKARERVGPDTGSSEVQIAILTAKIRRLADEYEGKARQDKVNKRNLRLLVHKRQKLLNYFLKKSRGGPQWTHLVETLGLTPATWKGEISM